MSILDIFAHIVRGLPMTAILTFGGFALGAVIAVPVTWARTCRLQWLRVVSGSYIEVARGVPPIVWLFLLFFGLNQFGVQLESLAAAIIGLGIIAAGYLAEIYRSGLKAVPTGQFEAAQALSLPRTTAFVRVTAPQAMVTITPLSIVYFIGLLKDSAVASVIGVQEVTATAVALSKRSFDGLTIFVICGLVYLVVSFPVSVFGQWLGARVSRLWAVPR
jgi:polar amino acid transport system permease protein